MFQTFPKIGAQRAVNMFQGCSLQRWIAYIGLHLKTDCGFQFILNNLLTITLGAYKSSLILLSNKVWAASFLGTFYQLESIITTKCVKSKIISVQ